ncbi:MAG: DNA gyrase inhibitor YacG [Planctomycetaceae bacterium]|nr:DNA gyrase inhibitor YacG [Planctomycetaceae bacterium]
MATIRCPICEKQFDPAQSPAMPFCSERCRQIDLGRWLRETYSVPVERNPDEAGAGDEAARPDETKP